MKTDLLPADVIALIESEGQGLTHGIIQLKIFLRDGRPRWEVTRSRSILDDSTQKGIDSVCQKTRDDEGIVYGL